VVTVKVEDAGEDALRAEWSCGRIGSKTSKRIVMSNAVWTSRKLGRVGAANGTGLKDGVFAAVTEQR
jgi:hypothetical protein